MFQKRAICRAAIAGIERTGGEVERPMILRPAPKGGTSPRIGSLRSPSFPTIAVTDGGGGSLPKGTIGPGRNAPAGRVGVPRTNRLETIHCVGFGAPESGISRPWIARDNE